MSFRKKASNTSVYVFWAIIAVISLGLFVYKDDLFRIIESPQESHVIDSFYFHVPKIVVVLKTKKNKPLHVSISLTLNVRSEEDSVALKQHTPEITKVTAVLFMTLTSLDTMDKINVVREELLLRINKIVKPIVVRDILFKEILIN